MKICIVTNKGDKVLSVDIDGAAISVGRSPDNDIQIQDNYVSRSHFVLWQSGKKFFLKDLGSVNGTFVNGHRLRPGVTVEMKSGYAVVVGRSMICLGAKESGSVYAFLEPVVPCNQNEEEVSTAVFEKSEEKASQACVNYKWNSRK